MRKTFAILLSVALMVALMSGCGEKSAESVEVESTSIRISSSVAESHPTHLALEKFKEIVEAETDGSVTVEIYPNSVLGSEDSIVTQLQNGGVDSAVLGGISYLSHEAPLVNIEEVPFLFSSYEEAAAAYNGEYGKRLTEIGMEPFGLHVANYWINGFRHFTNSVRPLETPEDMKGIKFRSAPVDMRLLTFETLGASAISVNFNELFTALQQGTVNGQENPLSIIQAQQFYEVQEYLSLSGHIYNASPFVFSQTSWDSYSDALKDIITSAAAEAQAYQYELVTESEESIVEDLKAKGMKVNEIDYDSFRKAVQPVWDNFIETYGEEGQELLELAEAAK